jgi:hypothetical protein
MKFEIIRSDRDRALKEELKVLDRFWANVKLQRKQESKRALIKTAIVFGTWAVMFTLYSLFVFGVI